MKRIGNLWDNFISDDNINLAIRKAIKGKRDRHDVRTALANSDIVEDIRNMIINKTYPKHRYRKVIIYEGKKRNIYVIDFYPWRIIHHMVINMIESIFEKRFIDKTYGCIRNRGQFKGSKQCWEMVKRYEYCLKCDIHKFYPSIKQHILSKLIRRVIKDEKFMEVVDKIIFSHYMGCPIGNLPSQLFGNIYLSQLDYYCKHELRSKTYIRYVDDFLFFSNNKQELHNILKQVEPWLKENLGLTMSKGSIFKTKQGVDFLGYRHFKGYKLLRKKTAQRMMRKANKLEKHYDNGYSLSACMSTLSSMDGWVSNCNSYNLQKKLNTDKIRENITRKEFIKKGRSTEIYGKFRKPKDGEYVIINAYSIDKRNCKGEKKNCLKFQYKIGDILYYYKTFQTTVLDQFNQIKIKESFEGNINYNGRCIYMK